MERTLPAKKDAAYASPRTTTCTLYTITKSDSSSSIWEREREQATRGKTSEKKNPEQQGRRFIHTKTGRGDRAREDGDARNSDILKPMGALG